MKLLDLLSKLARDHVVDASEGEGSTLVYDEQLLRAFLSDSTSTMLVSFPRTGSHWLRMMMELYFERPSLTRVFYYPDNKKYLTYHTHDMELDVEHPTIIYLYRNPVDTVYSQLNYYKETIDDTAQISRWSDLYGRHLNKWLHTENFTTKKTIVRYEDLKNDLNTEFEKVVSHFNQTFNPEKLAQVSTITTMNETKRKTVHDQQVINFQPDYEASREKFRVEHSGQVWDVFLSGRAYLKADFE